DAVLGGQILTMIRENLENQPFHTLRCGRLRARNRPGLLLDRAQAMLADRLDNRVLGGKEAVDVGGRHLQLSGDVGHGGLGEAKPTEQRLRGLDDPSPGIVWPDFGRYGGRRVHGRGYCSVAYLMTDDIDNSSVIRCQGLFSPWPQHPSPDRKTPAESEA